MEQRRPRIADGNGAARFPDAASGTGRADGLTRAEIEDNILTFIGAGHETTARSLAWTLYLLAEAPDFRAQVEAEVDRVVASGADPVEWLELLPYTRAAFEEAMRLYPPAPNLGRAPLKDDVWTDENGKRYEMPAGEAVLVMPWVLHRHNLYWDKPRQFMPGVSCPETAKRSAGSNIFPSVRAAHLHRRDLRASGSRHRARRPAQSFPFRNDDQHQALAGPAADGAAAAGLPLRIRERQDRRA